MNYKYVKIRWWHTIQKNFNFNIEFFEIGNKLDESHGEYARIYKLAELNYEKQLNIGYDKAIDPKSCLMY